MLRLFDPTRDVLAGDAEPGEIDDAGLLEDGTLGVQFRTTEAGEVVAVEIGRLLLRATPDQRVIHLNGDTLDNRRENLRAVDA